MNEHQIPVRKDAFLLGRVKHSKINPKKYEVKIIKRGIPKKIEFRDSKEIFIVNDDTAEQIIKDKWEWYVNNKYKNVGKRSSKDIIEHPVQIEKDDLKKFQWNIIKINSVKYYFPAKKKFLSVCDEVSSKIGNIDYKFDREELYEDI